LAARISRSESASESVGSEVSDGDGVTGDSTGITTTQFITTASITPGAERFTTAAVLREEQASEAELSTGRGLRPDLLKEIGKRLGDTLHQAARAACDRAPSAATAMADRKGATRHAEAPVWVAEARVAEAADLMVVADGGKRS
jgi:hypothetical protein